MGERSKLPRRVERCAEALGYCGYRYLHATARHAGPKRCRAAMLTITMYKRAAVAVLVLPACSSSNSPTSSSQVDADSGQTDSAATTSSDGSPSSSSAGDAGGCKSGGTGTVSSDPACIDCVRTQCVSEAKTADGSGWASGVFGGDGPCAAYISCTCACAPEDETCRLQRCLAQLDDACSQAQTAYTSCQKTKCQSACYP
jgi:hypothetical protein